MRVAVNLKPPIVVGVVRVRVPVPIEMVPELANPVTMRFELPMLRVPFVIVRKCLL